QLHHWPHLNLRISPEPATPSIAFAGTRQSSARECEPEGQSPTGAHATHARGFEARAAQGRTWTAVPASLTAPCQSGGTAGSVHSNSQAASTGERLTQPWLRGVPKPSCQYVPWSA